MLLRIDNHHRMTNSSCKLVMRCTMNRHVGDQIRDVTHLMALAIGIRTLRTVFDSLGGSIVPTTINGQHTIIRFVNLRIEVLELPQRRFMYDLLTSVGNHNNMITIKVRTRQMLCYLGMDQHCIWDIGTKNLPSIPITVVNRQFRNLKRTRMRIPNKNNTLAILERRSVNLIRLDMS